MPVLLYAHIPSQKSDHGIYTQVKNSGKMKRGNNRTPRLLCSRLLIAGQNPNPVLFRVRVMMGVCVNCVKTTGRLIQK